MANVSFRNGDPEKIGLEAGDIIATEDIHFMVGYSTEIKDQVEPWMIIKLSDGDANLRFKHPTHIFNHVKKHYGSFRTFKAAKVDIVINN